MRVRRGLPGTVRTRPGRRRAGSAERAWPRRRPHRPQSIGGAGFTTSPRPGRSSSAPRRPLAGVDQRSDVERLLDQLEERAAGLVFDIGGVPSGGAGILAREPGPASAAVGTKLSAAATLDDARRSARLRGRRVTSAPRGWRSVASTGRPFISRHGWHSGSQSCRPSPQVSPSVQPGGQEQRDPGEARPVAHLATSPSGRGSSSCSRAQLAACRARPAACSSPVVEPGMQRSPSSGRPLRGQGIGHDAASQDGLWAGVGVDVPVSSLGGVLVGAGSVRVRLRSFRRWHRRHRAVRRSTGG